MEYSFTEHARQAMEKRRILLAWIEQALSAPEAIEADPVDDDLEHRLARIPDFGNRVLRVIVTRSAPLRIVTEFFDRRRRIV